MQNFYVERGVLTRPCQSKPGQITLPYRRYYRSGNNRLTVFFLGGGPGVSHLSFKPPQVWLDLVDVIVLEYRGVGQSSLVLSSPYFTRALRKPITALNLKGSTKLGESVAQGFKHLQQQGIAFEDFGLNPMADDVEALRQQLGLGKIILIAHSFGTRVAQVIQTRQTR